MRFAHLDRPHWVYELVASDSDEIIYAGVSSKPRFRHRVSHRPSFGKAVQHRLQDADDRGACVCVRLVSLHPNREEADLALCRLYGSSHKGIPKRAKQ